MRIMLDTNVLVSLLLFPNERINAMPALIFSKHELVLSLFQGDCLMATDVEQRKELYRIIRRLPREDV